MLAVRQQDVLLPGGASHCTGVFDIQCTAVLLAAQEECCGPSCNSFVFSCRNAYVTLLPSKLHILFEPDSFGLTGRKQEAKMLGVKNGSLTPIVN